MKRQVYVYLIVGLVLSFPVFAQTPDFQDLMNGLQGKLDAVSGGAWSEEFWSFVVPVPPESAAWAQQGPSFPGWDHTGNGIKDDDHLVLFQRVLEKTPLAVEVLGQPLVDEIAAAFAANREAILAREAWFDLEIFNSSRADVRWFGITLKNKPISMKKTRLHTGQKNKVRLCIDTTILFIGILCGEVEVSVPSIWGEEGLLSKKAPGLADDLADLLAAYSTIGDQESVDYLQAVIYQIIGRGILPAVESAIFNASKFSRLNSIPNQAGNTITISSDYNKRYTVPLLSDIDADIIFDPPIQNCLNDSCSDYVNIVRLVARISAESIQQGIGQDWLNGYAVGDNGFSSGYETFFGTEGDLNGDALTNLASYTNAGQNRHRWFVAEGIAVLDEGEENNTGDGENEGEAPVEGEGEKEGEAPSENEGESESDGENEGENEGEALKEGERDGERNDEGESVAPDGERPEDEAEWVVLPVVAGQTLEDAIAALHSVNLEVGEEIHVCSNDIPEGCVIYTEATALTRVPQGTAVDLWISDGDCPCCNGFDPFSLSNFFLSALVFSALIITAIFRNGNSGRLHKM